MLAKAASIRLKYWPGDNKLSLQNKDYLATTYGIDSIIKHSTMINEIEDNMKEYGYHTILWGFWL